MAAFLYDDKEKLAFLQQFFRKLSHIFHV